MTTRKARKSPRRRKVSPKAKAGLKKFQAFMRAQKKKGLTHKQALAAWKAHKKAGKKPAKKAPKRRRPAKKAAKRRPMKKVARRRPAKKAAKRRPAKKTARRRY